MFEFKHPKYYKELRKRNRDLLELSRSEQAQDRSVPQSDQVISANKLDGDMKVRAPGPGLKQQASSAKQQASSIKHQANQNQFRFSRPQAPSDKHSNQSNKRQASSHKQQAP